ncbi:MAG: ornithine cyclodeaminase family protein [Xanthobacteraceae bacterium]|nr:ornithine cyclodeaminase family protein [Xanthobacteraceae bacterium]
MKLRILTESDCRAVLDMKAAIDIQGEAFTLLASGRSIDGLRSFATSDEPPGVAIFNPCFLRDGGGYGIKVVSDFYRNGERGVPRMSALVALFDGETGAPHTVMEGGYLTDLRTGAGTGLAARYLARHDSRVLTVVGAGRVAANQVEALAAVLDLSTVLISSRTRERAEALVGRLRQLGGRVPSDIRYVGDSAESVAAADVVVAATTSHAPVVQGSWLRPGTFVASVGAYEPTSREVDSETIRRASRRIIDSRNDCLAHAGDLVIPSQEGVISLNAVPEIADLVGGRAEGRKTDDEITFYKSIGVPIQDLVTAQHIERRARERGIGLMVDIGGDHD